MALIESEWIHVKIFCLPHDWGNWWGVMVNSKGNSEDKQKHVLDSYSQIPQFLLNYQISKFSFWIKKKIQKGAVECRSAAEYLPSIGKVLHSSTGLKTKKTKTKERFFLSSWRTVVLALSIFYWSSKTIQWFGRGQVVTHERRTRRKSLFMSLHGLLKDNLATWKF